MKREKLFLKKLIKVLIIPMLLIYCWPGLVYAREIGAEIIINLPSRTLELYYNQQFVKEYPIAIGKASTPTPLGQFQIIQMEVNPEWVPPRKGYIVVSGPDNPLGYRWMGFLPLYGIHGTNTPWAIGAAVSNGCVRMAEKDAEELFDMISIGTPVRIVYERVRAKRDARGKVDIGVYPDVYGYKEISVLDVYNELDKYGLLGFVDEERIQQLLLNPDTVQTIACLYPLKVNDALLSQKAVHIEGVTYVPIWPIAEKLEKNIIWDQTAQLVYCQEDRKVSVISNSSILYVTAENLQKLFGGQQRINEKDYTFEYNSMRAVLNGKTITQDIEVSKGILALPVISIAESLGWQNKWDEQTYQMTVQGKVVPVDYIKNQPYIQITKINEFFNIHVYWNADERLIELTYPSP